jgi:predicted SnoaL-like aldol condensation-catalyzing enzyme
MADNKSVEQNKEYAIDFLNRVVAGQIEAGYAKYVDMGGKHHNAYYPAGFAALKQGMLDNHLQFPHKQLKIGHVIGDNDMVAVHSIIFMKQGEIGVPVVHIFHFSKGKIVEMWDLAVPVPADSPNRDSPM